jgi:hypothetical protein
LSDKSDDLKHSVGRLRLLSRSPTRTLA